MRSVVNKSTFSLINGMLDAELAVLEREPDYIYVVCVMPPTPMSIHGKEYVIADFEVTEDSRQYVHRTKNAFPFTENHLYELHGYRAESILAYGDEISLRFDSAPPVLKGGVYSLSNKKAIDIINAQKQAVSMIEEGEIPLLINREEGDNAARISPSVPTSVNPMQRRAIERSLARPCHLVLGPPGTGKTHLISSLCELIVRGGKTVLVTSWMNVAVDNALEKILYNRSIDEALVCRASTNDAKVSTLLRPYRAVKRDALTKKSVVGATLASLHRLHEMGLRYDYVVIDEAGSASIPQTLLAYLVLAPGGSMVLIGDHKQLPPVIRSEVIEEWKKREQCTQSNISFMKKSLFEHLISQGKNFTMLQEQYRMMPQLADLITELSYGDYGRLVTSKATKERLTRDYPVRYCRPDSNRPGKIPAKMLNILTDRNKPVVWISTSGNCSPEWRKSSAVNKKEIYYIRHIVDELCHRRKDHNKMFNVGIIAPYRSHVSELKKSYRGSDIRIHTIHSVQGKEMDVVIISMVDDTPTRDIFRQKALFNVALSRAKYKLIIICNETFLCGETPDYYASIHRYCETHGAHYAISSKAHPVSPTTQKKMAEIDCLRHSPEQCLAQIRKVSIRSASTRLRRHAIDTYFGLVRGHADLASLKDVDLVTRYYGDTNHLSSYERDIVQVIRATANKDIMLTYDCTYLNPYVRSLIKSQLNTR